MQIAGELATFTAPDKRATAYPAYRHDDLQRTFAPVVADLRRSLSSVLETNAVAIPLQDRKFGVRVGPISDRSLLRASQFVLTVSADVPGEQLRRLFPNQVKIGAVEHIRELVNVALPGIAVRPLPVAPRQIPFHAGAAYFELDREARIGSRCKLRAASPSTCRANFRTCNLSCGRSAHERQPLQRTRRQ